MRRDPFFDGLAGDLIFATAVGLLIVALLAWVGAF